ncbi:MAG: DUF4846 domain-containing protein [Leptospiraceae bacterium]|nr:DUF4846 domain-containing protein [Leptospiraceae bacterium]
MALTVFHPGGIRPSVWTRKHIQGRGALLLAGLLILLAAGCMPASQAEARPLRPAERVGQIPAPAGYNRVDYPQDGFASFLRSLTLLESSTVYLYNGLPKRNQSAHFGIVDLSVGKRDLQQCADALIRLRAEFFYRAGRKEEIRFHFTSGDLSSYSSWSRGMRPVIQGNRVRFLKKAAPADTPDIFWNYLENLFTYAGTISLKRDSEPVPSGESPRIGDFFLQSGSPGHAVMILDHARSPGGLDLYLLGQSYMPAQQFHVLRNPYMEGAKVPGFEKSGAVWYALNPSGRLETPEWSFPANSLRRWNGG